MESKFTDKIGDLVATMVDSYRKHPNIVLLGSGSLPNRDTIIEIIHGLRALLFPGYFGKQNLADATMQYPIGELILTLHDQLYEQIAGVLKTKPCQAGEEIIDLDAKTEEIVATFFHKIPEIREYLATDVQAAFEGDPAAYNTDEIVFSYPGVFALSVYRLAHELYTLQVPLIPRIMTEYAHSITGIDIHPGAKIGRHFFIDHGTGVVIGETTVIGNYVKIYHGVTLGALSTRGGQALQGVKRHPTIEDEVTVYSGASILGGDTVIGKGAAIASNVFITQSVAEGTRVSVRNPELLFKGHPS